MTERCPTPEELSRALTQEPTTDVVDHVASCSHCAGEWDGAMQLRALVRALPAVSPERERAAAVRARVLAEAASAPHRGRTMTAVAVAVALAAAIALGVGLRRPSHHDEPAPASAAYHGVVTAAPGARYARLSGAPDEVVLLQAGSIHVEVSPLGRGERFRVRAGDGEVEVRGTAFDVGVEGGHLTGVSVQHGRVEVRGAGPAATLQGGESWHPTAADPVQAPAPADDAAPSEPAPGAPRARAVAAPRASATAEPDSAPVTTASRTAPTATTSGEVSAAVATQVPPTVNAPSGAPPPATTASTNATAAPRDDRDRDEQRRERRERAREERRERHDERRLR